RVALAYATCCALWGSTWMVIRIGLRDLPPLTFAAARMALAGALLTPFALRSAELRMPRARWTAVGTTGLLQIGIPYALMFAGQQWVPSGLAAVLFATFPVWVVLIARWLLPRHSLTFAKGLACLLGIAGIALLQSRALREQSLTGSAALGGALMVLAAIIVALANVLARL